MSSALRNPLTLSAVIVVVASLLFIDSPWRLLFGTSLSTHASRGLVSVTDAKLQVTYQGIAVEDIEHFQNIFYAQDTSGERRFAPPVPYVPPPGTVVDATAPGAWCPQFLGDVLPFSSKVTNVSENCLSLRIARPAGIDASAKLPVVVFIHGGGHVLGSAYEMLYTPDGLVKQSIYNSQHIIYLAMNYRLGMFGFAASKALMGAKHTNAGLRDQRIALEWIRANIEHFGGDPVRITAVGHSVGACDIGFHLLHQEEQDLPFQKAIMLSGAPGLAFNFDGSHVAENTAAVAKSIDCVVDDDPDSEATLACLRDAPMEDLRNVSVTMMRGARAPFGEQHFGVILDHDYIRNRPSVLLGKGDFYKDIPLIGSWTTNDGALYVSPAAIDDDTVLATISPFISGLSEGTLKQLLSLYPVADFEHLVRTTDAAGTTAQYYRAAQIHKDLWFTCPVLEFTWQYARHSTSRNVRLYEFNQSRFGPVFEYMGMPQARVTHLSDVPYIFNWDVPAGGDNSPDQQQLARFMSGSVAAFAHTGDPTRSDGKVFPDWPEALSSASEADIPGRQPDRLTLNVIGGPHGSGPVTVARGAVKGTPERVAAVEWEKLFERCDFINSAAFKSELGV